MFLRGPVLLVLSSGHIISATPFLPAGDHKSNFSGALNVVEPLYPSNASTSPHDTSTENSLTIHCDGEVYGHNPSIRDCDSISKYLTPDETIWTFAQRHSGLPPDTVPLPFLLMGDQGLCYIQTVLIGDYLTATASKTMLRRAAAALVGQCAADASQGGIATNIGKEDAKFHHRFISSCLHTDLHLLADTRRRRQPSRCSTQDIPPSTHLPRRKCIMAVMQTYPVHHARRQNS